MNLTESHNIKKSYKYWKNIDLQSFYSKNLYNSAIFEIKKELNNSGKWLRYYELDKILKNNENYSKLPAASSQQTLMLVDKNFKSYFALLKKWKTNKKSLSGCPKIPKYKDRLKGRNIIILPSQQISIKDGFLIFPKKLNNLSF